LAIGLRLVRSHFTALIATAAVLTTSALTAPAVARFQDATPATPLTGVYIVSIGEDDLPAELADGSTLVGLWNLTFKPDGTYSLARQDVGEVVTGTFEAGPATLTITAWDGIIGCEIAAGSGAPATYAWRQTDDLLTLTPIDESCVERLTLLTTRALGRSEACAPRSPSVDDPFVIAEGGATPVAAPTPASGVAAQEGYGEGADVEEAIDGLLRQASGCWASANVDGFMSLHSQGVTGQLAMMGPAEDFTRELRTFMESPLGFERIGEVNLVDPDHAWAYVEIDLGGEPNPQRVNFVLEQGEWLFDSFFLFGPPSPGGPVGITP
jgi:hypothetical protein